MFHKRIHSVRLAFVFGDREREQRTQQGQFWIIGEKKIDSEGMKSSVAPFNGGRIVYESPPATTTADMTAIWFTPREYENYFIWYKPAVGGTGDPIILAMLAQLFCLDDRDKTLGTNYEALVRAQVIPTLLTAHSFYRQVMMISTKEAIQKLGDGE